MFESFLYSSKNAVKFTDIVPEEEDLHPYLFRSLNLLILSVYHLHGCNPKTFSVRATFELRGRYSTTPCFEDAVARI